MNIKLSAIELLKRKQITNGGHTKRFTVVFPYARLQIVCFKKRLLQTLVALSTHVWSRGFYEPTIGS